ncbi:mechanosensitive ion channel [Draconibacterium sp.]|nr:mechanosensitive ion channel [Draconibacterium sp.]
MNSNNSLIKRNITILIFVFAVFLSPAQETVEIIPDSLTYQPIKLSDVPLKLAKTIGQTKEILNELISDKEIAKLKQVNDSILNLVEQNEALLKSEMEIRSIRYLENRKLQLQFQKGIVDNEIGNLTGIIKDLSRSIQYFNDEKIIWTNTKGTIRELEFLETIVKRIDLTIIQLDSAKLKVAQQAEDMLLTLDRSSEVSTNISLLLSDLNEAIKEQERKLLDNQHPTIFNLNYSFENLKFNSALRNYLKSEWREIKTFITSSTNLFVFILFLFIVLLSIFIYYQNRFKKIAQNVSNYYQKKLIIVLSKPISASVLLTILSTAIFFRNLPLGFRDLLAVLVVIPLIIIIKQLLNKKLLFTVYVFAVIMLLNILLDILSPENIIFRFYLLLLALVEIYFIYHFLFHIVKDLGYTKRNGLLNILGYLFLTMAITGFYGAIMGNVMLAKDFLIAVNVVVIMGTILYASLVTINGLIITILDVKALSKINFFNNHQTVIKKRIIRFFNILFGFFFVVIFLKQLNVWIIIKDAIVDFFTQKWKIVNLEFSLTTVLVFILVIYLTILISKTIQIILEDDILNKMPLDKGLPHSISMVAKYTLITAGVLMAVSVAGMPLTSLTVILGAFGVGIGFGLQNIFNNLVSGLILLFERPVQIGDTIEIGTLIGKVRSIGIRASNIQTFDGAEVIVPNGHLISNEVINWTLSDQQRRIEVIVGVSYSSDPHQVHKLMMQVLSDHKEIMQDPEPRVLFNEFGESSLDFRLLFWTKAYSEWLRIRSEIVFEIFDLLKENNIEIPFPQRDIHVRSIEQELKVVTPSNKK